MKEILEKINTDIFSGFNEETFLIYFSLTLFLLFALKLVLISIIYLFKGHGRFTPILLKRLQQIPLIFITVISLYIAFINSGIDIGNNFSRITQVLLLTYIAYTFVKLLVKGINDFTKVLMRSETDSSKRSVISYLSIFTRISIWAITFAIILENVGISVSALIAGLGISGFAIAFALRSFIKDIIASIVILFEKPIKLGDRIIVSDRKGYVTKIGLKSTKLREDDGREIIIPNSYITEKIVKNYKGDESDDFRIQVKVNTTGGTPDKAISTMLSEKILAEFGAEVRELRVYLCGIEKESYNYLIEGRLLTRKTNSIFFEGLIHLVSDYINDQKLITDEISIIEEEL